MRMEVTTSQVLLADLPRGGVLTVNFPVSEEVEGKGLLILLWDGTKRQKVDTTFYQMDDKAWVKTVGNKPGLFILVERVE